MNAFYDAPYSRAAPHSGPTQRSPSTGSRPLVASRIDASGVTTQHHRSPQRLKVTAPAKQRFAGFFNERRSTAPKFPTASRFKDDRAVDDAAATPGPAAYNTARSSIRNSGVSFPHSGRGASPQRTTRDETPGPGAYNVAAVTSTFRKGRATSHTAVIPRASRDAPLSTRMEAAETPGPGAYNTVISSFAKATQRSSTPRGRGTIPQHASRSTSASAFQRRTTHSYVDPMGLAPAVVHENADETPGPGAYRVAAASRVLERHAPAAVFPRASRFDDRHLFGRRVDEDGPGVAAYAGRVVDRKAWLKNGGRGTGTISRAARFPSKGPSADDSAPGPGAYTPLWGLVR